jgi:hypothetical protein
MRVDTVRVHTVVIFVRYVCTSTRTVAVCTQQGRRGFCAYEKEGLCRSQSPFFTMAYCMYVQYAYAYCTYCMPQKEGCITTIRSIPIP